MADADTKGKKPGSNEDLLNEVGSQLKVLRELVEKNLPNTFSLQNVKQKIQEAETGIMQELRNIKIDAEMAIKKAEEDARRAQLGAN